MHGQRIVQRGINPNNIVDRFPNGSIRRPLFIDLLLKRSYTLLKVMDDPVMHNFKVSTPFFATTEADDGRQYDGKAVDLYNLGVIFLILKVA